MKLSDFVFEFLYKELKIDTVFTVSGGGCIFLLDSLYKNKNIKGIPVHHEQVAAIAAEGYTRITNNIGICLVTSGPGGTNTITGILGSWLDSIPLLVLSGNVATLLTTNYTKLSLRQLGDQEFNIADFVKPITKYSVQVNDKNKIKKYLTEAIFYAKIGRPGPVWIDIPLDIQNSDINLDELEEPLLPKLELKNYNNNINHIVKCLEKYDKPLLIVGNGISLAKARTELKEFLQKSKIPVVTSVNGNDLVTEDYIHYCGRFGTHAQIAANKIIQEANFILSIGSRWYVRQISYNFKNFGKNAYKIYCDIDKNELNKPTIFANKKYCLDAKFILEELNKKNIKLKCSKEWLDYTSKLYKSTPRILHKHINKKNYLSTYYFISMLNGFLKSEIPIVTSNGTANVVTMQMIDLKKNQRLITNTGCAPMGYGLPCAIGVCFGINKSSVICIEGDGSLQMNIHDLQTVFHYQLPIKIFVINNQGYLSIKLTQNALCNGRIFGSTISDNLSLPNYFKIANAYNIQYESIKIGDNIKEKLEKIMNINNPILCEIFIDPNELHEPKIVPKLDQNGKIIPADIGDISWISEN